jgi:hypothetical protein
VLSCGAQKPTAFMFKTGVHKIGVLRMTPIRSGGRPGKYALCHCIGRRSV